MQLPVLSDITVNLSPPPESAPSYEYEFTLLKHPTDPKNNDLKDTDILKYTKVQEKKKLDEKLNLSQYALEDGAYIYKVVVSCQAKQFELAVTGDFVIYPGKILGCTCLYTFIKNTLFVNELILNNK